MPTFESGRDTVLQISVIPKPSLSSCFAEQHLQPAESLQPADSSIIKIKSGENKMEMRCGCQRMLLLRGEAAAFGIHGKFE